MGEGVVEAGKAFGVMRHRWGLQVLMLRNRLKLLGFNRP